MVEVDIPACSSALTPCHLLQAEKLVPGSFMGVGELILPLNDCSTQQGGP